VTRKCWKWLFKEVNTGLGMYKGYDQRCFVLSGDMEMAFGSHGMLQSELHQPFPGQMRSMRPGMSVGMRPPHMTPPGHYALPHRQMPPYSEVQRPEVRLNLHLFLMDLTDSVDDIEVEMF